MTKVGGKVAVAYKSFKDGGYKEIISAGLDFIPVVGNAKALVEAAIGRDPITGRKLESWERGASVAAILGGPLVKGVKHSVKLGAKAVSGATSGGKATNKTVNLAKSPTPTNPPKQQANATTESPAKLKEQDKGAGIDNPKTRLPRTNGKWEGEPGNGKWYSDKPEVKSVTNGEGVEFIDGRPKFTPWSKGSIKFKEGMLDGSKNDFNLVYEKIMQLKGFKSQNQAKSWLKEKGLTPHHKSSIEIELIPTDLHGNIPHIGSASDLRGGKSK